MQERHLNRKKYFQELAETSSKFYLPYLSKFIPKIVISSDNSSFICDNLSVLEIGCGEGGNLLPFAQAGAYVCGVDMAENKIAHAQSYFDEYFKSSALYDFISSDIFAVEGFDRKFDLILVHDVIEHIHDKKQFLEDCKRFLNDDGLIFFAFPPWQMPFGGHHQMAASKLLSKLPYIHLMHKPFYRALLQAFGESQDKIKDLMEIKDTGISIGRFISILNFCDYSVMDRRIYLINPHYEAKFRLKPRMQSSVISYIPYLRDLCSTSCWLLVKKN